jgi:hypothetical protein
MVDSATARCGDLNCWRHQQVPASLNSLQIIKTAEAVLWEKTRHATAEYAEYTEGPQRVTEYGFSYKKIILIRSLCVPLRSLRTLRTLRYRSFVSLRGIVPFNRFNHFPLPLYYT